MYKAFIALICGSPTHSQLPALSAELDHLGASKISRSYSGVGIFSSIGRLPEKDAQKMLVINQ